MNFNILLTFAVSTSVITSSTENTLSRCLTLVSLHKGLQRSFSSMKDRLRPALVQSHQCLVSLFCLSKIDYNHVMLTIPVYTRSPNISFSLWMIIIIVYDLMRGAG
jgi:hypothetical protein